MEAIIDLHGCHVNPKETVMTALNQIINELEGRIN